MKKIVIIAVMAAVLSSCGNKKRAAELTSDVDSLKVEIAAKDSMINQAFLDIDEIASSLNQIAIHQNLVAEETEGGEIGKSAKVQIDENILAISELLEKNKSALARLNRTTKQLSDANVEISGLKKLLESLELQISEKNTQIAELSAKLESMDYEIKELSGTIATLASDKEELQGQVSEQTSKLNTVHYIVGLEKDLKEKGVIDTKGFISRTSVVGSNLDELEAADLRTLERIEVGGKKAKLVTSHPEGSYMLVQSNKNITDELVITDKEAFWSNSKILIISYK